jgi:hypothetical protein
LHRRSVVARRIRRFALHRAAVLFTFARLPALDTASRR